MTLSETGIKFHGRCLTVSKIRISALLCRRRPIYMQFEKIESLIIYISFSATSVLTSMFNVKSTRITCTLLLDFSTRHEIIGNLISSPSTVQYSQVKYYCIKTRKAWYVSTITSQLHDIVTAPKIHCSLMPRHHSRPNYGDSKQLLHNYKGNWVIRREI